MGAKQSSNPRVRTYHTGTAESIPAHTSNAPGAGGNAFGPSTSSGGRSRTQSLGSAMHNGGASGGPQASPLGIPVASANGGAARGLASLGIGLTAGSPDSDASTPDEGLFRAFMQPSSLPLPVHLLPLSGISCPVCSKFIGPDDIECHLVMCLTRPRVNYNEDVLREDKEEECVICLEELAQGDVIARLQCLCIYHKRCIDSWFRVNRSCPEHPND